VRSRRARKPSSTTPEAAPRAAAACLRATLAAGLALAACAGGGPPSDTDEPPLDRVEAEELVETSIRVENRHWSDVTIYMFQRSARARIGTVTSNSAQTFHVPVGMGADGALDVVFVADAIGSDEAFRTERLSVLPGQEVLLRLEVRLPHSSASVFWP